MKEVLLNIVRQQLSKRIKKLEYITSHAIEMQEKVFKNLIGIAKNTEWGSKFQYAEIRKQSEFCNRVDFQDYSSLKPYIERMMRGEKNILWPGNIRWFAKSSGTTGGKSKFIPVTYESLHQCHFKAGKDFLSTIYHIIPATMIHKGYGVTLAGHIKINEFNKHSATGDLSAILMKNLPFWTHIWQKPGLKTTLMADWEIKIAKIAHKTKDKNITHITGIPTWTVILIHKLLDITGKSNLADLWPDLELYIHGGVSFEPYKELFKKLIVKENMHYLENYNASEGYFGFQDQLVSNDLLLLIDHGIYYEFIPIGEIGNKNFAALTLAEVEMNKSYAMVISTNAGLWRYMIGDTIRFTSLNPFRFRLSGRTKNFINAFGEEVIIENAEKAIAEACLQTGAIINDYTAGPVFFNKNKNNCHEWIIEFSKQPSEISVFTDILDKTLQSVNSDYEAKRFKGLALSKPIITIVQEGTFYNWLKIKGKLGGQNKVPRLYNTREYLDEIREFVKISG